jgi:hypothetical protein
MKKCLVVLGMMGRCPYGGQTWLYLNWLRGLARLGHEVWYVEDDTVWPYDPVKKTKTSDCTYAVNHIAKCLDRIGLADRWAFRLVSDRESCWGLNNAQINDLYRRCDALLNICGATGLREEHLAAELRVYVETDPVTLELKLAEPAPDTWNPFDEHQVIVTYGENYGAPDCGVPLQGIGKSFFKTRQPIDLELWPMTFDADSKFFTTIGNYRQQGSDVRYNGQTYHWSKHHEWEKFIDLPRLTDQPFELAMLPEDPVDLQRLRLHGWRLVSPLEMSLDIFDAYPEFIRRSRGEFTVAKDQNIRLRSGWFSERDACYLATGKPVVTQDTGFGNILPTDEGLFAVSTVAEAAAAIEAVNADYGRHCRAARAIANEYFAAEQVAARFLADVGLV